MTTNQQPFRLSDGDTTARYPFALPGHEPMGIRFSAMPYAPPAQPSQLDAVLVRPNAYTAQMGRRYPRVYRALYRQHSESHQSWPHWCFVPTPIVRREMVATAGASLDSAIDVIRDAPIVAGLAAWRVTKGVYDFHPTLLDRLWNSSIDGELPIDMFRYLPEWCVYIPVDPPRGGIRGCFAFVDEDVEDWFPRKLILLVDQDAALVEVEIELKAGADILAAMPLFSGYNLSDGFGATAVDDGCGTAARYSAGAQRGGTAGVAGDAHRIDGDHRTYASRTAQMGRRLSDRRRHSAGPVDPPGALASVLDRAAGARWSMYLCRYDQHRIDGDRPQRLPALPASRAVNRGRVW